MVSTLLAAAAFALSAQSAPVLTFEGSLGAARQEILKTRASQVQAKSDGLARDIENLAAEANRFAWDASRARSTVRDLRWRAQRQGQSQPGRPGSDPWLRSDLDRLVWNLRDLQFQTQSAASRGLGILNAAQKDPALVAPATRLQRDAQNLASEARWLESDARWASYDFRNAGYQFQAWDVERYSGDAARNSGDLSFTASRLLSKVQ